MRPPRTGRQRTCSGAAGSAGDPSIDKGQRTTAPYRRADFGRVRPKRDFWYPTRPLRASRSQPGLVYEYELEAWKSGKLEDLDYIHSLAASQWLDWLDRTEPLYFESYARRCLHRTSGWGELRLA